MRQREPVPDRRESMWREKRRPAWTPFAALATVAVLGLTAVVRMSDLPPTEQGEQQMAAATQTPSGAGDAGNSSSQVFVANTEGNGVYIMESLDTDRWIRVWPDGTVLKIIGDDQAANGAMWRHVEDPAGNQGWVPAKYTAS